MSLAIKVAIPSLFTKERLLRWRGMAGFVVVVIMLGSVVVPWGGPVGARGDDEEGREGAAGKKEPFVSPLFDGWVQSGVLSKEREPSDDLAMTIWTHRDGAMDVTSVLPDDEVDGLVAGIVEVFAWSADYIRLLDGPVSDYDLVIARDYPKTSISNAVRGTATVCANVARWTERLGSRKSRREMLYISASHELYHVQNYQTDPDEEKFFRELFAMIFESAVLVKRNKIESLWGSLGSIKKQVIVSGVDFMVLPEGRYDASFTRGLARWIANEIHGAGGGVESIVEASKLILHDQRHGANSLDGLLAEGKVAVQKEPATYAGLVARYRAYLERADRKE